MAKTSKSKRPTEATEIVTEDLSSVTNDDDAAVDTLKKPKIVIDGFEYDASRLSDPAKGAIASMQFAEAKIMALQNELAVCQTARYAYIKGLKAEIEGKAADV